MRCEELFVLWENKNLRLFIINTARQYTKDEKLLKLLIGKAWGVVSLGPPQKTVIYYSAMARNAIAREYNRCKYKGLDRCDILK